MQYPYNIIKYSYLNYYQKDFAYGKLYPKIVIIQTPSHSNCSDCP